MEYKLFFQIQICDYASFILINPAQKKTEGKRQLINDLVIWISWENTLHCVSAIIN